MSESPFANALDQIFATSDLALGEKHKSSQKKRRKKSSPQVTIQDLELAMTVLLVDLASADQDFDPREYQVIVKGLKRMFGTTKDQVQGLVNRANLALQNLRGSSRFAKTLKKHLPLEERETIMEIINEVIAADGVEDGFEVYLRHKFADLLGVEIKN